MNVICTICSNNHLARAIVLRNSLKKYDPDVTFIVFLSDEINNGIDYSPLEADEIIPIGDIEPEAKALALKYSILELSAALKSRAMEYLINERGAHKILYLDSDTKTFHSLSHLFTELDTAAILLTPHVCTPVPIDGKTPGDHTFLIYGIFNIGFIGLSNHEEARKFISWWKERTYKEGYTAPQLGQYAEQLPLNHVPVYFKGVNILGDRGMNMAPWNLHERYLSINDGQYMVNKTDALKFYHFSSFRVDEQELPLSSYNRFKLADRPDLQEVHRTYNEDLKAAGHFNYQQYTSIYAAIRKTEIERLKKNGKWWNKLFSGNKQ